MRKVLAREMTLLRSIPPGKGIPGREGPGRWAPRKGIPRRKGKYGQQGGGFSAKVKRPWEWPRE